MVLQKGLQLFVIQFATLRQVLRQFTNTLNWLFLTQKQDTLQVRKQKEQETKLVNVFDYLWTTLYGS